MYTASIFIAASPKDVEQVYNDDFGGSRFLPDFVEGKLGDITITEVICPDPDYGYWAQNLADVLIAKLPRVSRCNICDFEFVEQPAEDAATCPNCGADFSED